MDFLLACFPEPTEVKASGHVPSQHLHFQKCPQQQRQMPQTLPVSQESPKHGSSCPPAYLTSSPPRGCLARTHTELSLQASLELASLPPDQRVLLFARCVQCKGTALGGPGHGHKPLHLGMRPSGPQSLPALAKPVKWVHTSYTPASQAATGFSTTDSLGSHK